ncbi:MAG: Na(+)/H(+) antiporter subunit B [Devosiaceae bacterium]|nr:Na(+)/H(+) antiporter subunit B [Devosiaceae bacterium MH13]
MNTLILRTFAPFLTTLMMLFSVFVLLRGHNEPGGGFIGGLIAASALAIYGISNGVPAVRRAMWAHPAHLAGSGLFLSGLSGLPPLFYDLPFMTGLWTTIIVLGVEVKLSNIVFFDIGVYLVVLATIGGIALTLEERED